MTDRNSAASFMIVSLNGGSGHACPQALNGSSAHEMKRLGRDAAELTALADHLVVHGLVLEMLAGPLPGIYDPTGPGRILFAFFAALAETERDNIREGTLEGLDAAARQGKHGGRPPVITDDMLHTVLRRRTNGETVEKIQPDLIIPTGKRKGRNPSVASIYRALAAYEKAQAYPDAVEQAHAEYAQQTGAAAVIPRPDHGDEPAYEVLRHRLAQLPADCRPGPPTLEKYDALLTATGR